MESQLAGRESPFQHADELSPEDAAEHFSRREERLATFALFAVNPAGTVCGQTATSYNRMHVRMKHQVLAPGVQHHQTANVRSQVLRIGGDFQERPGGRTKQDAVDHTFVLQCQRSQFMRQREHHVEVRYGKQFAFAFLQPDSPGHRLALGAVPVAAGIVLNPFVMAVVTLLDMFAQLGRSATNHRSQDLTLLAGERVSVLGEEGGLSIAKDIGNFQGNSHHAASSSIPVSSSASASSSNSIGLGASRSSSIEMCV